MTKNTTQERSENQNTVVVCPTVTAIEPHEYRIQMERIVPFAKRIHIDLADGVFTPNKLMSLDKIWWPDTIQADIHLMYKAVTPFLDKLLALKPSMVVMHAEAVDAFYPIAKKLKTRGIKVGVALLAVTPVKVLVPAVKDIDHVLIFSGDLGHFGGHAQLSLLQKVSEIKRLNPTIEVGWDGGINEANVQKLVLGGVDVLNVGGAIHRAPNPAVAYDTLKTLAERKI